MKIKVLKKQFNSKNCIICGIDNPLGLNARFYELENGELAALFTIRDEHQSYPGRSHGGISAALLDETVGRAIMIKNPDIWGVTVELSVKYRKPIPLNEHLTVIGRITEENKRLFYGTGELLLSNGEVAATAEGKYMKMPLNKISDDHNFLEHEWFLLNGEEDPEYIELP